MLRSRYSTVGIAAPQMLHVFTVFVFVEQLIAIVADKLTDSVVIRDLHAAASRGVVVYIILNQRPAQDNQTPNLLKHPVSQIKSDHPHLLYDQPF